MASPQKLVLDGFTDDDLQPPARAKGRTGRLTWLYRDEEGYRAQPYEQLAAHYRRLGYEAEARDVLLAKQLAGDEPVDHVLVEGVAPLDNDVVDHPGQPRSASSKPSTS